MPKKKPSFFNSVRFRIMVIMIVLMRFFTKKEGDV